MAGKAAAMGSPRLIVFGRGALCAAEALSPGAAVGRELVALRRVLRRVWAGHSPRLGSLLSRVSVPVYVCTHTLSLGSSRWHPPDRSALGRGVYMCVCRYDVCVCRCVVVCVVYGCPRRGECPAHTLLRRSPSLHAVQYTPTSIAQCPITPVPGASHGGVPHTPASCKRRPHNASSFHSSCTHDLNIHPLPWWSSCITNGQARAAPHHRLISLATEAAPPGAQTSCQLAHRVLARVQTGLPGWPVRHLSIPRAKGCAPAPCMHAGRELCGKRSQLPPSGFASPPCFQRPPRPACT